MARPSPEAATKTPAQPSPKASYRTARLEILDSLRSATKGRGGKGADGALGMNMMPDRRAKEDIVKIGHHPLGLGIYEFGYQVPYAESYGVGRRVGIMADEVAAKYPEAVTRESDGYLTVTYSRLVRPDRPVPRQTGPAIVGPSSRIGATAVPGLS